MQQIKFIGHVCLFVIFSGLSGLLIIQMTRFDRIKKHQLKLPYRLFDGDAEVIELEETVRRLDESFASLWTKSDLKPTEPVNSLRLARRLAIGLIGSVPSLEEIRQLQSQPESEKVTWYLNHLLADRRSSQYLAERLARGLVGVEDGPFIVFRRRKFVDWLSDQIYLNRPYDELVRNILTAEGLWTDQPAVNFFTRTIIPDSESPHPDPVQLAGRTSRAFLGMRIDCLQCHDDFLGNVYLGSEERPVSGQQRDFHALAAFFEETENSLRGIRNNPQAAAYQTQLLDREAEEVILASVPFLPELDLLTDSHARKRLAFWVTHPQNRPFARAIVNRLWALLLGRALIEPVDDIPIAGPFPEPLEVLVDDFVESGFDLHRLIRVIAHSQVFALESKSADTVTDLHEKHWAIFPITRLRPEQMAGGTLQATRLTTIDATSNILTRLIKFGQQNDFITRFGDPGEDEFLDRGETVTQRLLLMNGDLISENIENTLNAPAKLRQLTTDDKKAIEVIYLATLTRQPSTEEIALFEDLLDRDEGKRITSQAFMDLYWAILNSAEFRWNH